MLYLLNLPFILVSLKYYNILEKKRGGGLREEDTNIA
jgi:hypothetical protein